MNKWIRRGAVALAALGALAGAAVVTGTQLATRKMERRIDVAVAPVAYRDDETALERGRYLFKSRGCVDCHGANGAGREFMNDGKGMVLAAPDITPGGVTASYRPQDWVRTVRHGVKPDGRPLMIMPSEDYNRLTDEDLAALVAHVRHLPPAQPVPAGLTVQHGAYVANMCIGCHGPQLVGGKIPGAPPDWPAAANLTPGDGSVLPRYPDAEALKAMFRSGHRPDGSAIKVMPFESLREISDTDVGALHLYLKSLPPQRAGA